MKTQSHGARDEESGADSGEAACLQGAATVCAFNITFQTQGLLGEYWDGEGGGQ